MILGFGCSVPAVMTARTLENEKRQAHHHIDNTVHVLQCQIPYLCSVCQSFLPGQRDMDSVLTVCLG